MVKEVLSPEEFREYANAAHTNFKNGELTEKQYRYALARLGFNATEIDSEVAYRKEINK